MKMLVSGFALALTLAFTGPAFAQDAAAATDKASCDKAGGVWDDAAKNVIRRSKFIGAGLRRALACERPFYSGTGRLWPRC